MPLEGSQKRLKEKDFIHEEYGRNPFRFWVWLAVVAGFSLFFAWGLNRYQATLDEQYADSPFLQVTNRQFSLFLWQHPSYMRAHAKTKNGYLPAFRYIDKIGLTPEYADDFVIAPPELIFLYHTWHRLIGNEFSNRPVPATEFRYFLQDVEEWQPQHWKEAPRGYVEMVNDLDSYRTKDLNELSTNVLPIEVRQAFGGWKNYFFEGHQINQFHPTVDEIELFLSQYPHYTRNYWVNIAGDEYLKNISGDEMAPFLKVALYNFYQANKGKDERR